MQNPCIDHLNAVIYILRYLKSAPRQGLLCENIGNTQIVGYCDVDWVSSLMDRCSRTRYCVLRGGSVVS